MGIIKWCFCPTKKGMAENCNDKKQNFENTCYEELKPISDADKEYNDVNQRGITDTVV